MKYSLKISHSAIEQLRALPKEVRRNVDIALKVFAKTCKAM